MTAVTTAETARPRVRPRLPVFITRDAGGLIGAVTLTLVVLVALFGPEFAPHPSTAILGTPGHGQRPARLWDWTSSDEMSSAACWTAAERRF